MRADGTDWNKEAEAWSRNKQAGLADTTRPAGLAGSADSADSADSAKSGDLGERDDPPKPPHPTAQVNDGQQLARSPQETQGASQDRPDDQRTTTDHISTAEHTRQPGADAPGRPSPDAASVTRLADNARQPPGRPPAPGRETRTPSVSEKTAAASQGQWMPEMAGHRPNRSPGPGPDHVRGSDRSPDQGPDQRPDQPAGHWYDPLVTRMADIEEKRPTTPDSNGNVIDPEAWRRQWYRERFRIDDRHVPEPFDFDKARLVPDLAGSRDRPRGLLVVDASDHHEGKDVPVVTAYDGATVRELRARYDGRAPFELGFHPETVSHPEANAAMWLRLNPGDDGRPAQATLYINREPCEATDEYEEYRLADCSSRLQTMLPEGCKLTVYARGGYTRTFHGNPDRPDQRPERTR